MMKSMSTPTAQLVFGLLIGAAVIAAFAIGGDMSSALVSGALVVAFVLFVYFGRRHSEAVEVMSGIGDERTRTLYRDACAFAGSVMSFVLPGWWLVSVAQGEPDTTLSALCAIFAVAWAGAAVVLPRRG
jgi:O-antigen/teichoic acid export membrane protein